MLSIILVDVSVGQRSAAGDTAFGKVNIVGKNNEDAAYHKLG